MSYTVTTSVRVEKTLGVYSISSCYLEMGFIALVRSSCYFVPGIAVPSSHPSSRLFFLSYFSPFSLSFLPLLSSSGEFGVEPHQFMQLLSIGRWETRHKGQLMVQVRCMDKETDRLTQRAAVPTLTHTPLSSYSSYSNRYIHLTVQVRRDVCP